jgi:hypothetical protein
MKELIIKSKRARKALMGNILDGDDKREALPSVPPALISTKSQYELLRSIRYGTIDNDGDNKQLLIRELTAKLNGYKQQDVKKKMYEPSSFITMEQLQSKLIDELLTCVFCNIQVKLLYDKVRDDAQWTLDRIDNDLGHSDANTRIACLKCNLQRRRLDYDKFHWTKNLVITKEVNDDGRNDDGRDHEEKDELSSDN